MGNTLPTTTKRMDGTALFVGLRSLTLILLVVQVQVFAEDFTEMKIVEEPSSLGYQQPFGHTYQEEDTLKLRVQPANFSGPLHFKRLLGRCFHTVINDYKYDFCPFDNITQHEESVHWNPYKGVLGVWQEWEVNNNTFTAMLMKDGDACGDIHRSVKVLFVCGDHSKIMNATEPQRCKYELIFMTPLMCPKDAMLVYPSLSAELRHEWDLLEGEMAVGDLTEKGYNRRLTSIFEKAGIYLSKEHHSALIKKTEEKQQNDEGDFDSLMTCNHAYKALKAENAAMKLRLSNVTGES